MLQKIFKLYRHLAIRLIILIGLAIIPVNILAVLLTGVIINDFQAKLFESYSNEMAIYMTRVDAQLSDVEEAARIFIADNINTLSLGITENESIGKVKLYGELRDARIRLELAKVAYLKNNLTGEVLMAASTEWGASDKNKSISNQIAAYLKATDLSQIPAVQYDLLKIDQQVFQVNNYFFKTYSFGFLIDTNFIMKDLYTRRTSENEALYLVDKQDQLRVKLDRTGNISLVETPEAIVTLTNLRAEHPDSLISASSEFMDYKLIRVLDRADLAATLPLTDRLLQIIAFLSFLLLPLAWVMINRQVLRPLHELSSAMHEIERGNLKYQITAQASSDDFQYMNEAFNRMAGEIETLTIESYEKDIEKLEIEAMNLRLQVNPHLLLNSFNMIYNLAQSKNFKSIQDYARHLSDYFRYALRQNDRLVRLEAEMGFVLSYLEVQKIRFPGAFTSVYAIDDGLENMLVPPLLIENFVENSIKYALRLGSVIEIIIVIRKPADRLLISICDTGNGMPQEILEQLRDGEIIEDKTGQHIGIWNIRRRLKLFYGDQAVLSMTSAPGEGTQVWIELPATRADGIGQPAEAAPGVAGGQP